MPPGPFYPPKRPVSADSESVTYHYRVRRYFEDSALTAAQTPGIVENGDNLCFITWAGGSDNHVLRMTRTQPTVVTVARAGTTVGEER